MAYIPLEDVHLFPSKRDLNEDLDYILADIPFLAVGILAFCTFTFLTLVKRLGITLTTLHLSIVVAFIASVFDLSRILQREKLNTDPGQQLDSAQPLIKAREIGYAFSNSLRFIFFWIFVAEPPKVERDSLNARAGIHSGNWNALGFVGSGLRWLTLCLSLSVFALQVVWRLDNRVNEYTNAYSADSAIEVVLSAILALKILLNCSNCTITSKWICVLDYLGFIASLIFSLGFGVANIMHLKFTETILGRFLQGVNFYLLVLSSLLALFMPPLRCNSVRVPPFRPLSPKPTASLFHITPPEVSTPDLSLLQPRFGSPMFQQPQTDIPSPTAKISGWLTTQRQRLSSLSVSRRGESQVDVNSQLWKQSRAEQGITQLENASKDSDVFWRVYENPDSYLGTNAVQPRTIENPKLEAPRFGRGFIRSMSSRYSNLDLSAAQIVDRKSWTADSPVFGLNGIVRPPAGESATRSPGSVTVTGPDRSSDISDLFRKQDELDNSIAALKLLQSPTDQLSSPTSAKQSAEPSATQSEFSLSSFPNPPWATASDLHSPNELQRRKPLRFKPPSIQVDNVPFELVPPRMPASMMEHSRTTSLPISETADSEVLASARSPRFDSHGTQYDVTSFIGNLTGDPTADPLPPGHKKEFSGSSNNTGDLTIASSWSDNPERTATIVTLQQSKQSHVGSPLGRIPVVGSATVGVLPATRVTLPSKPKLDIGQPRPVNRRLREDARADIFERPRAVPPMNR